ncbi:MAG TPA: hypothetical protein VFI59_07970 [Actinomycetota bacterium]|nr:hypothetical protein [Actinomycetota bacterium]
MNRWFVLAIAVLVVGLVVTFRLPWGDCDLLPTPECGEGPNRFFVGSVTVVLSAFLAMLGVIRGRG